MFLTCCFIVFTASSANWSVKSTTADANLRGVAVVVRQGGTTIWATGSKGTIVRSTDSGNSWQRLYIPDVETLDFRGVQSFDGITAYVMSSGEGEKSRIYKTTNAGNSWELQYTGQSKSFFLDALACADDTHCFALSDPVEGKFLILATEDGAHWHELPREHMPAALPNEGAFAASNSSLLLFGKQELYFATGGPAARVFHSRDLGRTWSVAETPLQSGKASQGIFSIVRAGDTVVVVGGDYSHADLSGKTAAYSSDGGTTWQLSREPPSGFRSAVGTCNSGFFAVSPNGADSSSNGIHWTRMDSPSLNAITFSSGQGWAVGPKGTAARFLEQSNLPPPREGNSGPT